MPSLLNTPFTSEVYARNMLGQAHNIEIVLWAEQMVLSGFESDHLNILLGEAAPFNQFVMADYLNRIQSELNIPSIDTETEAVNIVATSIVKRHLESEHSKDPPLESLMSLYRYNDETHSVYDFYLLHFAMEDLKVGQYQYYWPNANRLNIDSMVSERFLDWMAEYPLDKWVTFEWSENPKPLE